MSDFQTKFFAKVDAEGPQVIQTPHEPEDGGPGPLQFYTVGNRSCCYSGSRSTSGWS